MAVIQKNGTWWIDCYLNGRRVRRKVGPDQKTAKTVERDLQVKAAQGKWLGIEQVKRISFTDLCKEFIKKQAGKAPNTLIRYKQNIRLHLQPALGNVNLGDLRAKQIEDYVQSRAQVAKPNTVNTELQQIKTMMNCGVRWGYLHESPARGIKGIRVAEKEPPCITREQVAALLEECQGWFHTFVAISLNTGLRLGETLALEWEDVDLRNGVIKVRSDEEFTTKSKRNRTVSVSAFLREVLSKAPRSVRDGKKCPHVIFTRNGKPPHHRIAQREFKKALERAGLPHFRVHDMRHTFGTTLAANGVGVRDIMAMMGHSDIKTTMIYLHASPDRMARAVENLGLDGSIPEDSGADRSLFGHSG